MSVARTASVFRLDDGLLTGAILHGSDAAIARNTPAGCAVVDGEHDHRNRRVDLVTGQVVPYQPPQPAATEFQTYDWDAAKELWVAQPTQAARWRAVRARRDKLLASTDWVALRGLERGEPVSKAWRDYRQALRDVPQQADPSNINWPTPPEA